MLIGSLFLDGGSLWAAGKLEFRVVDDQSGQPIAVRMTLFRSSGKPAPIRRGVPAGVGTAIDGVVHLKLPADTYRFLISRGPEFHQVQGTFVISDESDEATTIRVPRILSMRSEGWVSGDVAADIPRQDVGLRCEAENLHVVGIAEALTENRPSGIATELATKRNQPESLPLFARGDLVRGVGSASDLLAVGITPDVQQQLQSTAVTSTSAPSCDFVRRLAELTPAGRDDGEGYRLVILNPMSKDLPIWLATRRIDGITVLGEYLRLDTKTPTWPNSFPPERLEMKGPRGLGLWSVHIYQQMLEAGLYVPPLGTSGAGFQNNPLGYTRTYVFCGAQPLTASGDSIRDIWWRGLWEGKSMVTNGPMLRPTLEGQPPGYKFQAYSGQPINLTLALQLAIRDPVDYLEVVQNGRVTYKARLDEFARQGGRIPPLEFDSSGWVIVRVMTKYEDHYRAAFSAPWFVEFDNQRRISADAVAFFQDLLSRREQELLRLPAEQIKAHAGYVRAARAFWKSQAEMVNAP